MVYISPTYYSIVGSLLCVCFVVVLHQFAHSVVHGRNAARSWNQLVRLLYVADFNIWTSMWCSC